ncbi:pesticin C-terminus-like muramidase [Burkholderia sp. MBR-1]|uniref:pesticin C-terminus-like muramidase n=1 Tax=Burkholderia sp. MBR-1 TaxID=2732364 RepID=UPI001C683614|nr:pesticin C-terminus-like muramidase [Burkholderia sp. MBR-1]QMI49008.1 lytic transglycosylase domain-containing protein [Burkholderia sp. MBR-1]
MTDKHPPKQPPKKPEPEPKPAYTPLAWSYPFSPATKEGAASDATDPMTYMKVLATAEDGFFPLGASGIWHGGIHFGQKTGEALKQDEGIRAIATGEIVAYRLDNECPTLAYQDKRNALYSRGFVLIRHTLQLPPAPKKPDPAPAPSNAPPTSPASGANGTPPAPASAPAPAQAPAPSSPPPDEMLTFFSLYMHTLDWKTYKAALDQPKSENADPKAPRLKPLPYWEADRSYRALKPNKQDLPKPKPINPDALGDDPPQQQGADDALPAPVSGVRVRIIPNGKLLGLLPEGTELTVNEADNGGHKGWVKITKIIKGDPVGPVVGQPPHVQLQYSYVFLSELEPIPQSGPVDKVVVLKKPYPVKAGDVVAHFGQYQRYREAKLTPPVPSRPLLHLEVFAGSDLPAFIAKSQARAKELPDTDKPFLEILAGAKLVTKVPDSDYTLEQTGLKLVPVSDPKSRWVKVQPKTVKMPAEQPEPAGPAGKGKKHKEKPPKKQAPIETPTGSPFWIDSSLGLVNQMTTAPVKGWKSFPLKVSQADGPETDFRNVLRVVDLDKQGPQILAREDKDASGKTKRWWNVTVGTKEGGTRQGWVREQDHPKVKLCSPWDWPGFDLVDNSSTKMVDMFKRYLFVAGLAMGEDQDNFKPSADALATSDLIQKLEMAIDANHDGKVTAAELADAQTKQWLAEAISHMVVKSESEWGGNMGKWEDITPHMKLVPWKWVNEMERIKKLQWWEEVQGIDAKILPKEPKPWHFHPIGLIGNFMAGCSDKCKTDVLDFSTTEGMYYTSVEAFHLILDSEGFGEVPYVPGSKKDQSSGVTIGYGYDLGQQPEATASADLNGFFTEAEITRLLTAIGKHGDGARAVVSSFSDIKISEPKALEMAKKVKRRYAQFTVDAFPGITKLHPHCQGALLSLVYNRGSQLEDKPGQRSRVHMRNIKAAIQNNNLPEVAAQLRAMKVLWEGTGNDGLLKRREKEAVLFEKGMTCDCWR